MKIAIADVNEQGLHETAQEVSAIVGQANVIVVPTDVSKFESVTQFRDKIYDSWGEVSKSRSFEGLLATLSCHDLISAGRDIENLPPLPAASEIHVNRMRMEIGSSRQSLLLVAVTPLESTQTNRF